MNKSVEDILDRLVGDTIIIAHSTFNVDFKKEKAKEKREEALIAFLALIKSVENGVNIEKVLEKLTVIQTTAVIKAVNKKGLMNTGWDDIDREGGHLDFKVIAKAIHSAYSRAIEDLFKTKEN